MVPPRRQGTPTRLRNWAMTRPKRPAAATVSTVPGVTPTGTWLVGPLPRTSDSTTRAAVAEA